MSEFEKKFESCKSFLKEKGFVVKDNKLKAILSSIELGYPLLVVGPSGSGKTHLLMLLAEFFKGHYEYASLNGSVTIHDLTQERILDKDGKFKEHDMILARWLRNAQKSISICHLDEVNAAKPETLLALHPIMDIKKELNLPYSEEKLRVDNKAVLVMSCNEGDEYIGVNAMNAAFTNRYTKIHLPFLQGDELAKMLSQRTNVPIEKTKQVVKTWEKYMTSKEPDQLNVGIRVLERWLEMSKVLGLREAGRVCFAGLIAKDETEEETIVQSDFFVNLPN